MCVLRWLLANDLSSNISTPQTFSPAKAIFAGVGVLLLVSVLLDPIFHGDILTFEFPGCRRYPLSPSYALQDLHSNRRHFHPAGNLHFRSPNAGYDEHNGRYHG